MTFYASGVTVAVLGAAASSDLAFAPLSLSASAAPGCASAGLGSAGLATGAFSSGWSASDRAGATNSAADRTAGAAKARSGRRRGARVMGGLLVMGQPRAPPRAGTGCPDSLDAPPGPDVSRRIVVALTCTDRPQTAGQIGRTIE